MSAFSSPLEANSSGFVRPASGMTPAPSLSPESPDMVGPVEPPMVRWVRTREPWPWEAGIREAIARQERSAEAAPEAARAPVQMEFAF